MKKEIFLNSYIIHKFSRVKKVSDYVRYIQDHYFSSIFNLSFDAIQFVRK